MDPTIWSNLPNELAERICSQPIKMYNVLEDLKTLMLLKEVVSKYTDMYGEDGVDWLSIDMDTMFPNENRINYGVARKWKTLKPYERLEFFTTVI